jgi:hypothetical protein
MFLAFQRGLCGKQRFLVLCLCLAVRLAWRTLRILYCLALFCMYLAFITIYSPGVEDRRVGGVVLKLGSISSLQGLQDRGQW